MNNSKHSINIRRAH